METTADLTPFLRAGLLRDYRAGVNVPGMALCHNLHWDQGTLTYLPEPTGSLRTEEDLVYFHMGWHFAVGITSNAEGTAYTIREYNKMTHSWSTPSITLANSTGTIANGNVIFRAHSFMDMHDTWILFGANSTHTFIWAKVRKYDGSFGYVEKQFPYTSIYSGCSFNGRGIIAGCADWISQGLQFTGLLPVLSTWNYTSEDLLNGNNWVYWSTIGGGDVMPLIFDSYLTVGPLHDTGQTGIDLWGTESNAVTGSHSASDPLFLDMARRNECGMMPMDFSGPIENVLPLRKAVVVYGLEGVSAIIPHSQPIPTFGREEGILRHDGLMPSSALGGTKDEHVFITDRGTLYVLSADLKLEKLGYENVFSNYIYARIVPTDWPKRGYFITAARVLAELSEASQSGYVPGDDTWDAYFLSNDGLCSLNHAIIGVNVSKVNVQLSSATALNRAMKTVEFVASLPYSTELEAAGFTPDVDKGYLCTNWFDFGSTELKRIVGIEIEGQGRFSLCVERDISYEDDQGSYVTEILPSGDNSDRIGQYSVNLVGQRFRLWLQAEQSVIQEVSSSTAIARKSGVFSLTEGEKNPAYNYVYSQIAANSTHVFVLRTYLQGLSLTSRLDKYTHAGAFVSDTTVALWSGTPRLLATDGTDFVAVDGSSAVKIFSADGTLIETIDHAIPATDTITHLALTAEKVLISSRGTLEMYTRGGGGRDIATVIAGYYSGMYPDDGIFGLAANSTHYFYTKVSVGAETTKKYTLADSASVETCDTSGIVMLAASDSYVASVSEDGVLCLRDPDCVKQSEFSLVADNIAVADTDLLVQRGETCEYYGIDAVVNPGDNPVARVFSTYPYGNAEHDTLQNVSLGRILVRYEYASGRNHRGPRPSAPDWVQHA